jgi:GrpB-like predicted nucleotidyltransferase (UPF0157 family)
VWLSGAFDREACLAYEALKLRLEQDNTRGIGDYLEGKAPFIKAAVAKR